MNIFQRIFKSRAAKLPEPYSNGDSLFLPTTDIDLNPIQSYEQAYDSNTGYVYVAVNRLSDDVMNSTYQIRKPTDSNKTDDWAIATGSEVDSIKRLLKRPGGNLTWQQLIKVTDVSYSLTGQFFWHIVTNGGKPVGLQFIPSHWVSRPIFESNRNTLYKHTGWAITVPGYAEQIIPIEDIVRYYIPDPRDPFDAISPLEAVASAHMLNQYMRGYGLSVLKNGGGVPAGILSSDQDLTGKQADDIAARWEEKYKYTRDRLAVLGKGAKYQSIALPFESLDFTKVNESLEDLILAAYNVPRAVLGLSRDYNKANMTGALMAYLNYGLYPRLSIYENAVNDRILPRFFGKTVLGQALLVPESNYALVFDKPELEDREAHRMEWKEKLQLGTVQINEYRIAMGEKAAPDGDVYLVPANVVPIKDYGEYMKKLEAMEKHAMATAKDKQNGADNSEKPDKKKEEKSADDLIIDAVFDVALQAYQMPDKALEPPVETPSADYVQELAAKALQAIEEAQTLRKSIEVDKLYKRIRAFFAGKQKNSSPNSFILYVRQELEDLGISGFPELIKKEDELNNDYFERLKGKDGKAMAERVIYGG
jgi:phage portal protein BeeE